MRNRHKTPPQGHQMPYNTLIHTTQMNPIKIGKLNIGIFESLLFLFICAKLTHTIDWSWIWVLSPGWIALSIGAVEGLTEYFEKQKNK